MAIDPSKFHLVNVTDTCAVWNILSSKTLYSSASSVKCEFCLTYFVKYECLLKPRKQIDDRERELQNILLDKQKGNRFRTCSLNIEDLQQISILEKRKQLGLGELSSIAFAIKINQAFLTDDKKARRLAEDVMNPALVQTTPHLLGWLVFNGTILDGDKDTIVVEHERYSRPLKPHFESAYRTALEYKLKANSSSDSY